MTLKEIKAALGDVELKLKSYAGKPKDEAFSDEERAEIDGLIADKEQLVADMADAEKRQLADDARRNALATAARSSIQPRTRAGVDDTRVEITRDREDFGSLGEFYQHVVAAGRPGAHPSEKLVRARAKDPEFRSAAATTTGAEGIGADGGFLVPTEFSPRIRDLSLGQDALLPLCDQLPVSGNSMTFPADETVAWGTNGIRAYWTNESGATTETKPVLKTKTLRLHKLMAMCPMTDELLADAMALESYVTTKVASSIQFKTTDAIINGTGSGQPLGFFPPGVTFSSTIRSAGPLTPCVSVAGTGSTSTTSISFAQLMAMYGRMMPGSLGNAVWIMNNDVFPQIPQLTQAYQSVWLPPAGAQDTPAGRLLGRPIILSQSCQTLGTRGDIFLADLKGYTAIAKGPESATSIHLFFDYDQTAFRTTFRVDGQPWMSAAVTPKNGTGYLSHFVCCDTRTT